MLTRTKKQIFAYWFLILATFFMYIILTGSKNLYVAEKTTMTHAGFNSVALASTMEYYFYTYAAMQIVLIFLVKKLNVKWFLAGTISASAILTSLIAFFNTVEIHWAIYVLNGILQAGIWGCSMKILGQYLPSDILPKGNTIMSMGPAVAYFVSYGIAALFGDNWRTPFIVLSIVLLFAVVLFVIAVTNANRFPRSVEMHHIVHADGTEEDVSDEDKNDFIHLKNKKRKILFYSFSILFGLLVTSIYFSLNNVVDYFLNNVCGYDTTTSKLISMGILVLVAFGPIVSVRACQKQINFLKVGLIFFGLALVCAIALLTLSILNVASVVLLLTFYIAFLIISNGGRTISLSVAGLRMRDKIDVGVYSIMVNAMASIAAGLVPKLYVMIIKPEITDPVLMHQNWTNAFWVSVALCTVTVLTIVGLILWIKRLNKKDEKTDAIVSDEILSN